VHILTTTGFRVDKLTWLEGYYGTLSHQLMNAYRALPLRPREYGGGAWGITASLAAILLKPAFALFSMLYSLLDVRYKYTTKGHCKNYAAIATKPLSSIDRTAADG
jgi:hypothetical protein